MAQFSGRSGDGRKNLMETENGSEQQKTSEQSDVFGALGSEDSYPGEQSIINGIPVGRNSGQGMNSGVNVQEIVQAVVLVMEERQRVRSGSGGSLPATGSVTSGIEVDTSNVNWQQIKFATKLIPTFAGKDDENVIRWLERISCVARTYKFKDEVLVLAAVSQLKNRAQDWYNRQPMEDVTTWEDFKFRLRSHFEVKESYTATLAKIGQRIWKMHTEKFVDYAEDKLGLMQNLSLSEREKIELLADGVKESTLRKLVLSTWITNIPDFIEHVRRITEDSAVPRRMDTGIRFGGHGRFPNRNNADRGDTVRQDSTVRTCFICKHPGHISRDCRQRKTVCFHCDEEGHSSPACPKRGINTGTRTSHVIESGTENVRSPLMDSTVSTVFVSDINTGNKDKSCIAVQSITIPNIKLEALIDTGSFVCLMRKSVYDKYYVGKELLKVSSDMQLKGVNSTAIGILGKIQDQVMLEGLEGVWFYVNLLIVEDCTMKYDLLLGRQFFQNANLKLIYQNGGYRFEIDKETVEFIHTIDVIEQPSKHDIGNNLEQDMPFALKKQVINVFESVDSLRIEPVKDDYCAKVHLKDNSLFRYAPRRMSEIEKRELDNIIEDLLKRNIIKPSISPYGARVVLVPKRDGRRRMCVDLRPLNQRIYPQKYPFPIIDDQLDQLYGKKYFTKLDLKDGFHQIPIHSEYTKYFAFATHNGQYEYTRLPFGFSESPAEFQKRILNLYIDDLLIATVDIQENLDILRQVLIILKKYSLELNLAKCSFLKHEIEYLGYLITRDGITMSKRHVQAIIDYPTPSNVRDLQGFLGLCNFFRRFIRDFALKAKPLQNLLKKGVQFDFDTNCKSALEQLKRELVSPSVLRIYNPRAETELHTDASSHGFGAILLQKQSEGYFGPIAYFSKSTTDCEKNYHSFELETLAIVKAVERFHVYLQDNMVNNVIRIHHDEMGHVGIDKTIQGILKSVSSDNTVVHLTTFNLFGCPERIVSDRGTAFSKKPLNTILSADKIKPWIRLKEMAPQVSEDT
ncbi:uncharacterized protein [Temnothorax nylanderi]|uniref:uncharacterized protein n=1 Tax=Temnothorax nylanderi TaxID=102681 RepID=UPI003A8A6D08